MVQEYSMRMWISRTGVKIYLGFLVLLFYRRRSLLCLGCEWRDRPMVCHFIFTPVPAGHLWHDPQRRVQVMSPDGGKT